METTRVYIGAIVGIKRFIKFWDYLGSIFPYCLQTTVVVWGASKRNSTGEGAQSGHLFQYNSNIL